MAVFSHRFQCEHLRVDLGLEVKHQTHHARFELSRAHTADVGIVRVDLGDQLFQFSRQFEVVNIDHQPLRVFDNLVAEPERRFEFECDAGVVFGRPHAHRDDGRSLREQRRRCRKQQRAGGLHEAAPVDARCPGVAGQGSVGGNLKRGGICGGCAAIARYGDALAVGGMRSSLKHVVPRSLHPLIETCRVSPC